MNSIKNKKAAKSLVHEGLGCFVRHTSLTQIKPYLANWVSSLCFFHITQRGPAIQIVE